jgi:hypothetical protein
MVLFHLPLWGQLVMNSQSGKMDPPVYYGTGPRYGVSW